MLGRARDRPSGEASLQQAYCILSIVQFACYRADKVVYGRIAFDCKEFGHLDGSRLADPSQVIAQQVHNHQVFRLLLGAAAQLPHQPLVCLFI